MVSLVLWHLGHECVNFPEATELLFHYLHHTYFSTHDSRGKKDTKQIRTPFGELNQNSRLTRFGSEERERLKGSEQASGVLSEV